MSVPEYGGPVVCLLLTVLTQCTKAWVLFSSFSAVIRNNLSRGGETVLVNIKTRMSVWIYDSLYYYFLPQRLIMPISLFEGNSQKKNALIQQISLISVWSTGIWEMPNKLLYFVKIVFTLLKCHLVIYYCNFITSHFGFILLF